ncbi:steroidogenic factor 1-like [Physella acuta]|uniref:steroidogenic factor 1-like n=1 Tax=Physella acuta TaxID=109671 RepID=UPI0027DD02B0|nr:steroidogenic factor 1-like [Physella acuta]
MLTMASRSELGISPVLLQAIAQTLSSHTVQRGSSSAGNSPTRGNQLGMEAMSHHSATSGLVSHLLQNLNEPVASLMAGARSPNLSSDKSCVLAQAGLSMLGLSDNEMGSPLSESPLTSTASKNSQSRSMVISSEDLNNFLVKEEQSDDGEQTGNQTITTVSSMLSALASQHIQESLTRKGRPGHQADIDTALNGVTTTNGDSRSQPQIIIYSYINNTNQDVPSPQGNDIVLNDGDADSQTTYRVLLQPDDGADTKQMFSSELTFSSASNVLPVTDAQNTQDGMSQPCPVCGDKVSGYHYGIFTCESCKGFFKRTVQNKKNFVCPKASDCSINSYNRKKCPACRFKRCLMMGMKLEAIRQDRTRGGRSSYDGCASHLKNRVTPLEKKLKKVSTRFPLPGEIPGPSHDADDGSNSHRNLVAILNHNAHKQTIPSCGVPHIPELLRDMMNLEPLLTDDDLPPESLMETPFPEQALYSYMMQLAELRLYKLVRWARNLPQFGAISTDDQILLLQNCWSELIALSLCWRSIDSPNQISISSSHHITAEWAQHLGFEDLVIRLLNITDNFRKLYLDQFEYVALKVLLLITPDVKGLKEPKKIRDFQDKLTEALLAYTSSHYPHLNDKFGALLLRLPELSRISFMSKDILLKTLPSCMSSCGLLVELLKGDNKGEGDNSSFKLS